MDISPQRVRTAEFKTVKKGLDPDEVRAFLNEVATELERAQNQSTAMEARARAAVARLQELSEGAVQQATPHVEPEPAPVEQATSDDVAPTADQADTISRTLLLAQRTADTTVAEAEAEAERIRSSAEEEASKTLESTREMSTRLLDEAREEARRAGESERIAITSEVNSLLARRDFLVGDVDHLEAFLVEERSRLREAASALVELTERVPSGLGEVRRPLVSGAGEETEAGSPDEAVSTGEVEVGAPTENDVDVDVDVVEDAVVAADVSADTGEDVAGIAVADEGRISQLSALSTRQHVADNAGTGDVAGTGEVTDAADEAPGDDGSGVSHDIFDPASVPTQRPEEEGDQLFVQTDIADDPPTSFSYDQR